MGLLCFILAANFAFSQSKIATEYQVKAVFLFNFTQFVDWSPSAFNSSDDPFIIGIIGDDPFGSFLDETVAGEKFGTHPIQVKRYNDVKDINTCHILYISNSDAQTAKAIISAVSGKNILTVGDELNFNKWGGIVRFFTENNKIRFQIDVELSKAAQLTISSKLLSVAKTN